MDSIQILNYDIDGKIILQFREHLDLRYFAALLQQASIILKSAHIRTSQGDYGPRLSSNTLLGSSGLGAHMGRLPRGLQRLFTSTWSDDPLQQLRVSQEPLATSQGGYPSHLSTLNNSSQVTDISSYVSPYEFFSKRSSFVPHQSSPLRNLSVGAGANICTTMSSQHPPPPSTAPLSEGLTGSRSKSYQADHLYFGHRVSLPHKPEHISSLNPTETSMNTSIAAAAAGSNAKRYDRDALPPVRYLPFNNNMRRRSMSESSAKWDSGHKSALLAESHRNTSFKSRLRVDEEAQYLPDQQVPDETPLPSYKSGEGLTHGKGEILQTNRAKDESRTRRKRDDSEEFYVKTAPARRQRRITRTASGPKPKSRGRKLNKKQTHTAIKEVTSMKRKVSRFNENGQLDKDQRGPLSSRSPRRFKKQRVKNVQLPAESLLYQEDDKENRPFLKQTALSPANGRRRSARIAERVEINFRTQREVPYPTNSPDLLAKTEQKRNTDRISPGDAPSMRSQQGVGELSSNKEPSGASCPRTSLPRSQVDSTSDDTPEAINKPCSGGTSTPSDSTHLPIDPSHCGIGSLILDGQESLQAAECILRASKPPATLAQGSEASKMAASAPHVHHQVAPRYSIWMHPSPRIQATPVFSPAMVKEFSDLACSFIEQLREDLERGLDPQMVYSFYDYQLIQAQYEWFQEKVKEQDDVDLELKNTLMKQYNEDASRGLDIRKLRHYYSWHLAKAQR